MNTYLVPDKHRRRGNRYKKSRQMAPATPTNLPQTQLVVVTPKDSGSRTASAHHSEHLSPSESESTNNQAGGNKSAVVPNPTLNKGEEIDLAFDSSGSNREDEEVKLAKQIGLLWSSRSLGNRTLKKTREELNQIRTDLSTKLYAYKKLLVGIGREGRWAPFLEDLEIPLSTADRYVKRREDELARAQGKLLTEELPPTAAEVTQKVRKLAPVLIRFLTAPESVSQFMHELGEALQPSAPSA